ncbi:MAG: ubiquinol-cytochrome c reductase iron-sulfur subunit [Planctomycetota bacterium]
MVDEADPGADPDAIPGAEAQGAAPEAHAETVGTPLPLAQDGAGQLAGELDRRAFLGVATACLGACAGALGVVGAAVVGTPLRAAAPSDAGWFDLGPLERFAEGAPHKVALRGQVRDAFLRFRERDVGRVVLLREGQELRAFSAACPHNGCDVVTAPTELVCPCHDSHFGLDGERLSGESPRGLDPLEVKLEAGRVRVRYQRFQVGKAERRPV